MLRRDLIVHLMPLMASFAVVFMLVPIIRRLALRFDFVDKPAHRKIHRSPIPLMGGLAIYLGCILSMLIFDGLSTRTMTLLTGGTLLVITGLIDDGFKSKGMEFAVWPRVIIYILASLAPIGFGIKIEGITNIFSGGMILFPPWLAWITTVIWVFAITNMINFIDGVDGLATGIVTLSSLTLYIVAVLTGQQGSVILASVLVGACIAFLAYNFYPAKIFMGDAGAIFLGYTLAVLAIDGALKSAAIVSIFVPILALGVPIMDTVFVLTRRFVNQKGFHRADKLHTHHSLMKWGLTQTQTVSLLYFVGMIFSVLSILVLLKFS
jgi:UDP-GlcNAc:undecaprenyl-phosphate GlcNAc-1-phosphate transferase